MSVLQTLLSKFPKYSARKVRRLSDHLTYLEQLDQKIIAGQIAEDLKAYHLMQAREENTLNDDVARVVVDEITPQTTAIKIGQAIHADRASLVATVIVTPVAAARRALEEMIQFVNTHSDISLHPEFTKAAEKAHGIINGQAFKTDRTVIQARMSPQEELPLERSDDS